MIYLRLALAGLLLGFCILIGKAKAKKLDFRTKALSDFISFARQLEVMIRASGRTIPDALFECSRRLQGRWTGNLASVLAALYGSRKPSPALWLDAVKSTAERYEEAAALQAEDCQIITLFGEQLASSDMKSIGENYSFLYARLEDSLKSSERDRAIKGRLYNTIGILAGLAAAVVVI